MRLPALLGLVLMVAACGDDDDGNIDGGLPDGGSPDGAVAQVIEDLPVAETKTLAGLSAPVEVVVDDRGAPHIYAASLGDAIRVQGYLMARDRFGQMEFFRRLTLGRLAEIFSALQSSTIDSDKQSRFIGYNRMGADIYASLAPTDPTRLVAEAFVAGVNDYIDEILAARPNVNAFIPPGGELLGIMYNSPHFGHWEPADIFALARFQSANLSYDPDSDVQRSRARLGAETGFVGKDPLLQYAFVDLLSEIQAKRVYPLDGFPMKPAGAKGTAKGARAAARPPSAESLEGASAFLSRWRERQGRIGSEGSNNWVVSGSKTASHAPILANDPHLSLVSPGVWWYTHINTKRYGTSDGVNVAGVAFAALPGVVLGFNEDIAWGATTTGYDVTDVYDEVVTAGSPSTVLFNGSQVAMTQIVETINLSGGGNTPFAIDVVPHHGPIIPGSLTGGHALSVRYTGHTPSDELAFFLGLASAKNVADAWAAQQAFRVGSQNFVVVARDGEIAWNTESRIPTRDPNALTLNISTAGALTGSCPTFVLPGDGNFEWTGDLESQFIPKDVNPDRGFIATANADNVGVTDDGNPCNDAHYLGGGFADGYRVGRIVERLTPMENITADQMSDLQAETQSQCGDTLATPLVQILTAVIAAGAPFTAEEIAQLTVVRDRLAAWSHQTPHGVGATDPDEIADSIATTIFNVGITRIIPLAFRDEYEKLGYYQPPDNRTPPNSRAAVLLARALANPQMLKTYDPDTQETVLWDNINTAEVETKNVIVARGFLDALAFIEEKLGDDPDGWRWGRLHTVRFTSVVPAFTSDEISIPTPADPVNPDGYPRHGDFEAVDVGNFSMWAPTSFRHGAGASQRLVVEMLPTGPEARNALPGGQNIDKRSPHHADEAALWIANDTKPVWFREADVVQHAEARRRFVP